MTDLEIFISHDDPHEVPFLDKEVIFNDDNTVAVLNAIEMDDEEEDLSACTEEHNNMTISTDSQQFKDKEQKEEEAVVVETEEEQEEKNEYLLVSDTLSPLEKLLQFSNSPLVLQRSVAAKDLVSIITEIPLKDAIHVALPIILQLSKDNNESVKEIIATELDKIIYFYYQNAPPIDPSLSDQLAIPKHAFVTLIIEYLLDQNTTIASMVQQSIVTVASELAKTPKEDEKYQLHQSLLDTEIFEGVVMGLLHMYTNEEEQDKGGANLAKMVGLMLISALAPEFSVDYCKEKMLPIVETLSLDSLFYVRKEAAAAVGSLATSVEPDIALEKLLPLYLKLSVDTVWHVRRACVFSLPLLCQVLPASEKSRIATEAIEVFKNDVSRNVRHSLADVTGELISKFLPDDWQETREPGQVPEPLLAFFISLGNAKLDSVHHCAFSFPAVVLTAGVDYWDSHLKDMYLQLTKDYQLRTRHTFACSLHEIARIIGPERTERDLIQIFALYLMDVDSVKEGVLEHLAEFIEVLEPVSRNEYIPILAEVWEGVLTNWNLRHVLTIQLRDIAQLFDAARVVEHVFPLALRACQDEFAAIRESGVEIIPVILDIVKQTVDGNGQDLSVVDFDEESDDTEQEKRKNYAEALLTHVMEKLEELVWATNYRSRLIFTHICESLLRAGIHPPDFALFFLPRLGVLARDPIINVRIAASRTMATLCSIDGYTCDLRAMTLTKDTMLDREPGQLLDDIFYHLSMDTDQDVLYFIKPYITTEQAESFQKRKEVEDSNMADTKSLERLQMDSEFDQLTVFFSYLSNLDEDDKDEAVVAENAMNSPIISDMDFFTNGIEDYQEEQEHITESLAVIHS